MKKMSKTARGHGAASVASAALAAALFIGSVFIGGCAEEPADGDEVLAAAEELVAQAVEANRIFFWEGLPHEEPTDVSDGIATEAEYLPLTEEYRYLSEPELIGSAEAVYSESFCADIRRIAFEGVKVTDDEALFARYIEEGGVMKINRKLSEEGLPERLPVEGSSKLLEVGHDRATVSVEFRSGDKVEEQSVTLVLEAGGWRLDTPTY